MIDYGRPYSQANIPTIFDAGCRPTAGALPPGLVISCHSPTDPITRTGTRRELGRVGFEFLYAPDMEPPGEMHIWIPELDAPTWAENANHSLHNIQTVRGAPPGRPELRPLSG